MLVMEKHGTVLVGHSALLAPPHTLQPVCRGVSSWPKSPVTKLRRVPPILPEAAPGSTGI